MEPDDLKRLSLLLDAALARDGAERDAWLTRLEGDDARLAPKLRELLERGSDDATAQFVAAPVQVLGDAFAPAAAGATVGPYRLLRELGHGGMGAVWLAERADGQINRQVALKLPLAGWGPGLRERFAREREILSALEHPHIARLYDVGVDAQGRPYMALEYVEGLPIDVYCRQHAQSVTTRLELLLQVADAVAFAHSRLVLHRDLKPANVLVTAVGQVRLLDFGIAKLMQDGDARETALTVMAGTALTPDYASPEQLRGEAIGTASDVYSLGVVAYELLADARPYQLKRGTRGELEEAIAAQDVPPASSRAGTPALARALRGDLDAILNRALKKNPAERYPTVDAFAQDLRRHVAGQRVQARPDTLAYRGSRFVRRHRTPLAAGTIAAASFALAFGAGATALVVGALLAGLAAALWQWRRAREQAHVAAMQARTAEAVLQFLQGIFRTNRTDQPDPVRARRRTAQELLDEGAARIERELDDAPDARLRVVDTLADIYEDMVLYTRAADMRRLAVALSARKDGEESEAYALALAAHADMLVEAMREDEARAVAERAVATAARLDPPSARASTRADLALANVHDKRSDAAGLPCAERAAAALARHDPEGALPRALFLLGKHCRHAGRHEEARAHLRESIAADEQAAQGRMQHRLQAYTALGHVEHLLGRTADAEDAFRRALAIAESVHAPGSVAHVVAMTNYALFLARSARPADALPWLARAREAALAWSDEGERRHWGAYIISTELLVSHNYGRPDDAIALCDAQVVLEFGPEQSPLGWLHTQSTRAAALTQLGRFAEAHAALDAGDAIVERDRMTATEPGYLLPCQRILLLLAEGRADDAERMLRALHGGDARRSVGTIGLQLEPAILIAQGRAAEAESAARAALERVPAGRVSHALRAGVQLRLHRGRALVALGRAAEAVPELRAAQEGLFGLADPERSPLLADVNVALGDALLAAGDVEGARAVCAAAAAIHARYQQLGPQHTRPLAELESRLRDGPSS